MVSERCGDDSEYDGVGFVEISEILVVQDTFFFRTEPFDGVTLSLVAAENQNGCHEPISHEFELDVATNWGNYHPPAPSMCQ